MIVSLSGCIASKIDISAKPEDYNLDYWISQKIDTTTLDSSLLYESKNDVNTYLDSNYFFEEVEGKRELPSRCVVYDVYVGEKQSMVETIKITDPTISVYGLSMNSSESVIKKTLLNMGFTYQEYYGMYPSYIKDEYQFTINSTIMIFLIIH